MRRKIGELVKCRTGERFRGRLLGMTTYSNTLHDRKSSVSGAQDVFTNLCPNSWHLGSWAKNGYSGSFIISVTMACSLLKIVWLLPIIVFKVSSLLKTSSDRNSFWCDYSRKGGLVLSPYCGSFVLEDIQLFMNSW